jgi:hypothetical protein
MIKTWCSCKNKNIKKKKWKYSNKKTLHLHSISLYALNLMSYFTSFYIVYFLTVNVAIIKLFYFFVFMLKFWMYHVHVPCLQY